MVPHKTARGAAALERMKVFEGVPTPYDKVKRMVVPDALQALRLQKGHRFCQLGDLSTTVRAWGRAAAVAVVVVMLGQWLLQLGSGRTLHVRKPAGLMLWLGRVATVLPSIDPCCPRTSTHACVHCLMPGVPAQAAA